MMYNDYKFKMIPTIIGAFGFVPDDLKTSLGNVMLTKKKIANYNHLRRCKNY